MLKWAKTIDWLAINSSALVLLLAIQLLSAFSHQPVENPEQQTANNPLHKPNETEPGFGGWGFWEAFFTGLIAVYAVRQFGETRRSSERQLRAYVMVAAVHQTEIVPGTIPTTTVRVKNFGQTPAHNIRVIIGMGFARHPFTDMEWYSRTGEPAAKFGRSLGPEDDIRVPIDLGGTLSAEKILAMEQGKWALWLNGKVSYTDVFDEDRETEFGMFTNKLTGMGAWAAIDGVNRCT